ncbi:hypothetical protein [Aquicella lusitana]|uniref:Uncharacterized protein n=1 Tax=Aquicella lusitana TaxID=254246 RepID=A0A370GM59_9COXI|nr:hypothetical protein [Aquicella lusitana]RDI44822.1 hypothetical protein C8D86_10876 [Aquicella lusitana]VVC73019.1 hypothetical protein AQULUS_07470 [Aquicella lusitana]
MMEEPNGILNENAKPGYAAMTLNCTGLESFAHLSCLPSFDFSKKEDESKPLLFSPNKKNNTQNGFI